MDERAANYVYAGAGSEGTMDANREAFGRWRIVPRMLRDVSWRDLSTIRRGTAMPAPLLLAPIGVQKVVHPDGELATARAAAALGVPMIASTNSHFTLEEIAEAGGEAPRWFQLYWPNDAPSPRASSPAPRRPATERSCSPSTPSSGLEAARPAPGGCRSSRARGPGHFFQRPGVPGEPGRPARGGRPRRRRALGRGRGQPGVTWDDLGCCGSWRGADPDQGDPAPRRRPRALDAGVDGIVVSNPGGRQIDRAIGALEALPAIAEAVDGELAILFDSGVRSGTDMIKALALGADAVCLGRPYMWGLALERQQGVETVLKMVLAELDLTLALCGYSEPGPARAGRAL